MTGHLEVEAPDEAVAATTLITPMTTLTQATPPDLASAAVGDDAGAGPTITPIPVTTTNDPPAAFANKEKEKAQALVTFQKLFNSKLANLHQKHRRTSHS